MDILPEERFSIFLAYGLSRYGLANNSLEQVANRDLFLRNGTNKTPTLFRTLGVELRVTPNLEQPNSLFLNLQYFHQKDLWNTNFIQLQLGYSFYLLKRYP